MIAESATGTTPRRLAGMLGALVASAAPFVAVGLLVRLRGPATHGVRDLRWPAVALLGWELAVVLLGGSYWLHYLMGLVPGLVLLAAAAAQRKLEAGPTLVLPYAAALVSTVAAIAYVVAVPIDRPEAPVIDYLRAEAYPGDTAIVAFGGANILRETGMTSPYEHLWSLPVRVRDPELTELTEVLAGDRRADLGHRQRRLPRHLGRRRERGGQGPAGQLPARRERRHVRDLPAGRVSGRLAGQLAAYVAALVVWCVVVGIPNDPLGILLWGWLALFIVRRHEGFWRDWRPYVICMVVYWFFRGLADETFIDVRFGYTVRFDRWLGGVLGDGRTPTEQLQDAWCGVPCLKSGDPRWWDLLLNTVYASHFYVAVLLGLVLWVASPRGVARLDASLDDPAVRRARLLRPGPDRAAVDGHRRGAHHQPRLGRPRPRSAEHDPARHGQPGRRHAVAAHRHRRPRRLLGDQPAALTMALAAAPLPGRDGRGALPTSASTTWSTRSRGSWPRAP